MLLESDTVRMKVAPFVLADNTMPVKNHTTTVHVTGIGDPATMTYVNQDLLTELNRAFPWNVSVAAISDAWQQDGYEIGYAKAPYGAMPIVLELPRAHSRFGGDLADYVRGTIFRKDVGISKKVVDMWELSGN